MIQRVASHFVFLRKEIPMMNSGILRAAAKSTNKE